MAKRLYPFVPNFLLRYPLRTDEWIAQVNCPVVLFHGREDEVIPYESSVQLIRLLGKNGQLLTLPGAGHNGMTDNLLYRQRLAEIL